MNPFGQATSEAIVEESRSKQASERERESDEDSVDAPLLFGDQLWCGYSSLKSLIGAPFHNSSRPVGLVEKGRKSAEGEAKVPR